MEVILYVARQLLSAHIHNQDHCIVISSTTIYCMYYYVVVVVFTVPLLY